MNFRISAQNVILRAPLESAERDESSGTDFVLFPVVFVELEGVLSDGYFSH